MIDPKETYRGQTAGASAAAARLEARFQWIGWIRLAVFLAIVGLSALVVAERGGWALGGVAVAMVAFVGLLVWHERTDRERRQALRSLEYYQRGMARLEHRWFASGDDGQRFLDPHHLYAADLEIFGPASLFQLLSVARTETGALTLARWLAAPASPATVADRQAAVRELAENQSLRHDLAVVESNAGAALDSAVLRGWFTAPPVQYPGWAAPVAVLSALVNVVATAAALTGWVPGVAVVPGYLISVAVVLWLRSMVAATLGSVDRPVRELRVVARLLERVARERFSSPALVKLEQVWNVTGSSPTAEIDRVARMVDLIDARRNQLFMPISGLLLLGTQLALGIERWRTRVGASAVGWLEAIGELEALASLATFAFDRPDHAFPELGSDRTGLAASGLAHPLMVLDGAVPNDLSLGDPTRLIVVSGSNMSGKSTLLRAVGVNLVLAFCGAPVRARRLVVSPLALGASLVLRDSLLEGRSRFFAEILRLKEIVALAEQGRPVLFLLDELLSGTNSHDRAIGARGVLEGLIARGAIGLVTTHDLALARLADELGHRGANWHLQDTLVDGRLEFDYRLRPGVVERSNALELMRAVGLDVVTKPA